MLIFVRHGETVWKTRGMTQGQLDSPLTDKGKAQAAEFAWKLRGTKIDEILSSPLGRAVESARIIGNIIGITEIKPTPEFMERNEGAFQGLTTGEQKEKYPGLFDKNGKIFNEDDIPVAETVAAFLNRINDGISRYQSADMTKLVVTHSGVIQGIKLMRGQMQAVDFGEGNIGFLESLTVE